MYAEDLVQICAGLVHAASVSVSSYESCSAGLEDLVFLVSSIPSSSYTFSVFLFPQGYEGFHGDISLRLSVTMSLPLCTMSGCGSLYFFLSAVGGSFSVGWLSKTLIYEYNRMVMKSHFGATSFSRTMVFNFPLCLEAL